MGGCLLLALLAVACRQKVMLAELEHADGGLVTYHQKPYTGMAYATGEKGAVRFQDGKWVETYIYYDNGKLAFHNKWKEDEAVPMLSQHFTSEGDTIAEDDIWRDRDHMRTLYNVNKLILTELGELGPEEEMVSLDDLYELMQPQRPDSTRREPAENPSYGN